MTKYYDDLTVGDTYEMPGRTVTRSEIIDFANRYDPQPFHVDEVAAEESMFGELVASGLHTLCVSTRLTIDGFLRDVANYGGRGLDDLRWVKPVYPGDRLTARVEVVDVERPENAGDGGYVTFERTTLNQDDEAVMRFRSNNIVGIDDRRG